MYIKTPHKIQKINTCSIFPKRYRFFMLASGNCSKDWHIIESPPKTVEANIKTVQRELFCMEEAIK